MQRMVGRGRLSPSLIISVIALIVAVGGGSYAMALNKKQQTKKVIRKISKKLANKQINRRAPGLSVAHAGSADLAASATNASVAKDANIATDASHADVATLANTEYTWYHNGAIDGVPVTLPNIGGSVTIPEGGSYVIVAKLNLRDANGIATTGNCHVTVPGSGYDRMDFDLGSVDGTTKTGISLQATREILDPEQQQRALHLQSRQRQRQARGELHKDRRDPGGEPRQDRLLRAWGKTAGRGPGPGPSPRRARKRSLPCAAVATQLAGGIRSRRP